MAETLRLASRLYDRWDPALAARLADTLELPPDRRVGRLSKARRSSSALRARWRTTPTLLLLDEPTAGLDPTVRAGVQAVVP